MAQLYCELKDMIGESETSDIDLQSIKKYIHNSWESKNLCFLREAITDMNFSPGSHSCNPVGKVNYSSTVYINKHMNYVGLKFLINKITSRAEKMRQKNWSVHYTSNIDEIKSWYSWVMTNYKIL